MKKIIVYLDSMKPAGGKERVVSNLLYYWANMYNVVLITKDEGESFYKIPDSVERVSLKSPMKLNMNSKFSRIFTVAQNLISSTYKLRKLLNEIEYDYIYTSTPLNSLEAYWAMTAPQQKLVVSEHASINAFNALYSKMKQYVYPRAYCISVPNQMDTQEYLLWGCNAYYIPHLFTYKAEKKNDLNSKIVLSVGRLTADKQLMTLLEIWNEITTKNGWSLWIVGDGEQKDDILNKIKELKLEDTVKLFSATKHIDEVYQKASIFALTSRCEGFGMVLLESMAFGIPCIAFDCPSGPRDIVKSGFNGFLIENGNVSEYRNKLEELLQMSEKELQCLGDNAFEFVEQWDNNKIISKWDDIFV